MSILMLHTHTQFIAIILIHLDAPVIIRRGKCLAEGLTIYTLPMIRLNKECQSGGKEREREMGRKRKEGWRKALKATPVLQPFLSTPETNGQKLLQLMRTTYKP
ncbi:hypothetical protein PO909_022555 [Leuciscus waleckii]